MEPWNATHGAWEEKPVRKLWMAGVERVPPAPWVKSRAGVVDWGP